MAGQENQQYTVLYGRLSQEDERAGESNSIQHQRTLLEKYAKEKGFENTIFLADDGYSGTNFERPAWKKIVEMIEAGQVANLIVKDASRLGPFPAAQREKMRFTTGAVSSSGTSVLASPSLFR